MEGGKKRIDRLLLLRPEPALGYSPSSMARLPQRQQSHSAISSTIPRVSSPLAQHSTTSSSSYEESGSSEGSEAEEDTESDEDEDDDEDALLDELLQAAKKRAAARNGSGTATGGEAANLQDTDLALAAVECVPIGVARYEMSVSDADAVTPAGQQRRRPPCSIYTSSYTCPSLRISSSIRLKGQRTTTQRRQRWFPSRCTRQMGQTPSTQTYKITKTSIHQRFH
jgi:hypothetical protein